MFHRKDTFHKQNILYNTLMLFILQPKFIQVSNIWYSLQDQMVVLSSYNNILKTLKAHFDVSYSSGKLSFVY